MKKQFGARVASDVAKAVQVPGAAEEEELQIALRERDRLIEKKTSDLEDALDKMEDLEDEIEKNTNTGLQKN